MGNKLTSSFEARQRTLVCIIGTAVLYDLGLLGLQLFQWYGSSDSNLAIGDYSTALAFTLCLSAILLIMRVTSPRQRALAWASAAIFAVLIVDHAFSIHERMKYDDYLAVMLWLIAGVALFALLQTEKPGRIATIAISSGFFLHGLAALTDGVDGGVLTFGMISPFDVDLTQDAFEIAYIGLYLVGFGHLMLDRRAAGISPSGETANGADKLATGPARRRTFIWILGIIVAYGLGALDLSLCLWLAVMQNGPASLEWNLTTELTSLLATAMAPKFLVLYVLVASATAVHFRGRERLSFEREITNHATLLAPINCVLYLFSAVPNKPRIDLAHFPELKLLADNWQVFRDEGQVLYRAGHVKASKEYDDIGFNSLFRRGWKRFYLKWYGQPHPSALALCPKSVALLQRVPSVKAAMFTLLPDGAKLHRHRDPHAVSLRYHLGLVTPNNDKCRIYFDGEPYSWHDGEAVLFDATYIHHAVNESGIDRLILIADIERPMICAPARWFNRFLARVVMRAAVTKNEAGERVGALNRVFGVVHGSQLKMKTLKKTNPKAYYAVKYAAVGGALAAYLLWA